MAITYQVKSIKGYFDPFEIKDNGLGYLAFNIFEKAAETTWGPIGCVIGFRLPASDIRVRRKGNKTWLKIKYKKNSSKYCLAK